MTTMDAPTYRELDPEEAERAFPKRGQMDLSAYEAFLGNFKVGAVVEIDLGGLSERAMKRRLGQAANRINVRLKFKEKENGKLLIQIRDVPVATEASPRNANDGRFKKNKQSKAA